MLVKTFTPRIDPTNRRWFVADLDGAVLGRAAVKVANILRGKNKPIFAPHLDTGDHVIVVNASGLRVTGRKMEQKMYYRYSGYPGGLKKISLANQMAKGPDHVFIRAVRGMLPKNRLGRKMIKKLHVYAGPEHPHVAQKPVPLELK